MTPLLVTTLLLCSLSSLYGATIGIDEVSFGTLRFELHSKSSSEARVLLADLVARTSVFLDTELQAYFTKTISDDYFSHTGLSVADFSIDQTDDIITATIDLDGSAFFTTEPIPSKKFIVDLLKQAFQGSSRLGYVRELQLADAPFLTEFFYMLVELNGQVIATEDLSHSSEAIDHQDHKSRWESNKHTIIAAICAASAAVCVAGLLGYLFYRRKRSPKVRSPKVLRVKTVGSNQGTDADEVDSVKSPSPIHSICSQESSKFTYNPRSNFGDSTISGLTNEEQTLPSHFSELNVDVDGIMDVEAWTRHSTISPVTPAPFGNDISAILPSQKDLSLIMEASQEDSTPASQKSKTNSKLTQSALQDLDDKVLNVNWNTKKNEESWYSEEDSYAVSNTSDDVISDLKNLSMQINRQRVINGQKPASSLYGRRDD